MQAHILLALERNDEAIAGIRNGIEILESRGQAKHWHVAVFRAQLGRAYLNKGDAKVGMAQLALAYQDLRNQLGAGHPETLRVEALMLPLSSPPRS